MKPKMTNYIKSFRERIKASVTMMGCAISKKHTWERAKIHFMVVVWTKVRKALTTEHTKK